MIGSAASSHGNFSALIGYQLDGQKTDIYETLNLISVDQQKIAREMKDTVDEANKGRQENHRIQSPTYHVSFSWAEGDNPTRDEMLSFGRDYVQYMGLQEHQVVIAIHKDQPHEHIHIVANRVNPQTEDLWEPFQYQEDKGGNRKLVQTHYQQIEQFEREYEKQKGWRLTPGRFSGTNAKEFESYRESQGQWHYRQRLEKASEQLPEHIQLRTVRQRAEGLKGELYEATSFKEFDNTLASQNLYLNAKGQGAVITDGSYQVKASSVSRGFSGGRLEQRFGESLKGYIGERNKGVDIDQGKRIIRNWTSATERGLVDEISTATRRGREAVQGDIAELERYDQELGSIQEQIKEAFQRTFETPGEAWEMFGRYEQRYTYEEAKELMISEPERFGQVKEIGGVIDIDKAIRALDTHHASYPERLTAMDTGQRKDYGEQLQSRQAAWNRIDRSVTSAAQHGLSQGMSKSQAGRDTDKTATTVISVARASEELIKNPTQGGISALKQTTARMSGALQSEGGKVAGSVLTKTVSQAHNVVKMLSNPKAAPAKMIKNLIQSGIGSVQRGGRGMGGFGR